MTASTVMLIKSIATKLSTPAYESIVIIKRTFIKFMPNACKPSCRVIMLCNIKYMYACSACK